MANKTSIYRRHYEGTWVMLLELRVLRLSNPAVVDQPLFDTKPGSALTAFQWMGFAKPRAQVHSHVNPDRGFRGSMPGNAYVATTGTLACS